MEYVIAISLLVILVQFIIIKWLVRNIQNKKTIKETVDFFRGLWGRFVFYVIATSIIGLFICSFIFDDEITLSIMNEWVSLVLGLVALFIGIISLYLSFYNLDEATKMQKQNIDIMEKLRKSIEDRIDELKNNMNDKFDSLYEKNTNKNVEIKSKSSTYTDMQ